jgi:tellurite resistance protein
MSNFDRDPRYGHDRALGVLDDFASDAPDDQKVTVLNAALHVASNCHDGDLTPQERNAALEVAKILKLDPAPHGL